MPAAPRRKISAVNLRRLREDEGYGTVFYRKVPGIGRKYYDPQRPWRPVVTEDYVVRVYKPQLTQPQRVDINLSSRRNVRQQRKIQNTMLQDWIYKQRSEGVIFDSLRQARNDAEFVQTYQQFRSEVYLARREQSFIENPTRFDRNSADGELAELLVELGRRRGDEDFDVGESAQHVGPGESYTLTVVRPYLDAKMAGEEAPPPPIRIGDQQAAYARERAEAAKERLLRIEERRQRRLEGY